MIVKLNSRGGGQVSRRSPVRGGGGGDGKPSNIYERPRGPRTGIGYPKAGVIEVRFVIPSKIAGSGEVLKLVFAPILYRGRDKVK